MSATPAAALPDRLTRLRARLAEADFDGLLVGSTVNRRYLSGFRGSAGWVLITRDRAALATDFRYWDQASLEAPAFSLCKQEGALAAWLPTLLGEAGGQRLGFEAEHVSVAQHKQIRDVLAAMPASRRPSLMETEGLVEAIRAVKDMAERTALERAAHLGDAAFAEVAARIEPGWTELRIAREIERYVREHGGEGMAFPTIVGGGPWSALPHAQPRDVPVREGAPLVIDMGVRLEGYCSDMTRTLVLGQPDGQFPRIYDIVLTAQETAAAALEPGMTGNAAHLIAQRVIEEAGHGDHFGHGLGHGVGLQIHERPRVGRSSEEVLQEGMVLTVEPGIYLPGWGGVRIEDMGILENGQFRAFTRTPKLRMLGV